MTAHRRLTFSLVFGLALLACPAAHAQTAPNPTGLTEAMIAPCREWTTINNAAQAGSRAAEDPAHATMSNLEFVLTRPPYAADNTYSLQGTRDLLTEWTRVVTIMERRDLEGMRRVIGMAFVGDRYWPRLASDEELLCLLYVRRQQLTGQAFSRAIPTPASLGFPGQAARR